MDSPSQIGHSLPLQDGRTRVTGALRYAPDLTLPGLLYARFVTSPYAHATIEALDASEALAVAGVVAVLTADDMPDIPPENRHRMLLARERVRFVGQPVALVLAESEEAAEDGQERMRVEYAPLPVAVGLDDLLAEDAPLVWPGGVPGGSGEAAAHGAAVGGEAAESDKPSNVSNRVRFARGDIEAGLAEAAVVVERSFTTSWVHQSYLEPHATVVQPDPLTDGVTVWTSTQAPFYIQEEVADLLGVSESEVRVVATPVGGAFGGKVYLVRAAGGACRAAHAPTRAPRADAHGRDARGQPRPAIAHPPAPRRDAGRHAERDSGRDDLRQRLLPWLAGRHRAADDGKLLSGGKC